MRIRICIPVISIVLQWAALSAFGQQAVFVREGKLITFENQGETREFVSRGDSQSLQIEEYWGTLTDGRLLVTEKHSDTGKAHSEDPDHHCLDQSPGEVLRLINRDGTDSVVVYPDALRAYLSPSGNHIAIVTPLRDLLLWQGDNVTTVSSPGKVSNVGWSPDGQRFVASIYPPDWSEGAVSTASTTADFLRLQNADLHLYDVSAGKFVSQLSSDPGTEYGAFFSPDGSKVYYAWLHLTEDAGGLMELDLDQDNGTSASQPVRQLTHAGNDSGEVPLGRVSTYQWLKGGSELVFESGMPDGSGEIWSMKPDGANSVRHSDGRKPQRTSDNSVAYIKTDGTIQVYSSEVNQ